MDPLKGAIAQLNQLHGNLISSLIRPLVTFRTLLFHEIELAVEKKGTVEVEDHSFTGDSYNCVKNRIIRHNLASLIKVPRTATYANT